MFAFILHHRHYPEDLSQFPTSQVQTFLNLFGTALAGAEFKERLPSHQALKLPLTGKELSGIEHDVAQVQPASRAKTVKPPAMNDKDVAGFQGMFFK